MEVAATDYMYALNAIFNCLACRLGAAVNSIFNGPYFGDLETRQNFTSTIFGKQRKYL